MKPLRMLAMILVCTCCSSQAGTVTGTVEGTANISIAPVIAGQTPVATTYTDVPSVLTYTYDIGTSVNFSITNSVYSFDTASLPASMYPTSYGFSSYESLELMTLMAQSYHLYFLTADLELSGGILSSAGYNYSPQDSAGDGTNINTTFKPLDGPPGDPPPAVSVPEPSSALMMAVSLFSILLWRTKCVFLASC